MYGSCVLSFVKQWVAGPWAQLQVSAQLQSEEPVLIPSWLSQAPWCLVPRHPNFSLATRVIPATMSVFKTTFLFFLQIFFPFDGVINAQL